MGGLTLSPPCAIDHHSALSVSDQLQDVSIQPPGTEGPFAMVPISALPVAATGETAGWNIPAAASLIGDQRKVWVGGGDAQDEGGVVRDGREPIRDRERVASMGVQG